MDWTTLVATLVGAAIAMSSSLIVEIRRSRHDTDSEWRRSRREIYAEYLTVLSQARWELSGVAGNGELSDTARRAAANEIFARCYQIRHQLELYSPSAVSEPALVYFRTLRTFRNAIRDGLRDGAPDYSEETEYAAHVRQVKEEFGQCRDAMRADIRLRRTFPDPPLRLE
ncbi:hypothetical protein ACFH04_09875 [Streptomyces noboritoensis]|uniref:Secreted protein n=1 Tax=Streptomyces noboritoensis TaxID=67337 RepID=A0ABV6TE24_9ACTN